MASRWKRRTHWLPWAILVWTLAAAVAAAAGIQRALWAEAEERIDDAATAEQLRVQQRMELYVALLRGVAARFQSGAVDPASFHAYVARLRVGELYPGIQGVGFTAYVAREDVDALEEQWQRVYSTFQVWPRSGSTHVTSIVLLDPFDRRNEAAIGYDMGTEPVRAEGMRRAVDEGRARATGKVTLVQEIDQDRQAGFLIYVPVYDAIGVPDSREERWRSLRGYAYSPFRAGDLLSALRGNANSDIALDVYDGPRIDPGQLLHRSPRSPDATRREVRTVSVAGRTWTLVFYSRDAVPLSWLPYVTGAVGMLLSIVLSWGARGQAASERMQRTLRATAEAERERAERAAEVRERVVAIVSHDLRNPLSAVTMAATLLAAQPLPEDSQRMIERVRRASERMTRMIDQLLDFARLRQGTALAITKASVDVGALARMIVEEHRLTHSGTNIDLAITGESHANVDADRIAQVLANLVGNALQHGAGTPVQVRVFGAQDTLRIEVHNGGPPIADALRDTIFEPFARAGEDKSRSLGLGLYISREIVRAHGGELTVTSTAETGTTFVLAIPCDASGLARPLS